MEFSLGEKQFRTAKLDAFQQFHVSRKLAPIIPTLIPVFVKIAKDGAELSDIASYAEILAPFADGLAAMSNEDSEYVMATCMSVAKRKAANSDNWAPVWSNSARACMFDDMDLGDIIQIVMKVVQDSLGNFIRGLLMSQTTSPE
jgi:hypothetical protein